MRQNVILPYAQETTTQQDVKRLRDCLRGQRSTVDLRAFDESYVPVWLANNFGPHTITVTLDSVLGSEIFDYIPGPKFFARQAYKTQLLQALMKSQIRVPHSAFFTSDINPTEDVFGPYLTIKTTAPRTARGVGIYMLKTREFASLRGALMHRFRHDINAGYPPVLQQYVTTGLKPNHTCVTTFLGVPVVCFTTTAPNHFYPETITGIVGGDATSNFRSNRSYLLVDDEELVDMAKKVAKIFPETSVLGIDMVRCVETGKAYCLEVNLGNLGILSSPMCYDLRSSLGETKIHDQFGSYNTIAKRVLEALDKLVPR